MGEITTVGAGFGKASGAPACGGSSRPGGAAADVETRERARLVRTTPVLRGGNGGVRKRASLSREPAALGHMSRVIAPEFVRAFRLSGKNDANDAAAICAAVGQPQMRFVTTKTAERQLMNIEGVGPVTATAIVATVGNAAVFKNGRQFAAWLGLTPRQHSTGGKQRLGAMTKHGDVYLRTLLIHGARALLRVTAHRSDAKSRWAESLRRRRPDSVAAVALAAKHARIIWALLVRAQEYQLAT